MMVTADDFSKNITNQSTRLCIIVQFKRLSETGGKVLPNGYFTCSEYLLSASIYKVTELMFHDYTHSERRTYKQKSTISR